MRLEPIARWCAAAALLASGRAAAQTIWLTLPDAPDPCTFERMAQALTPLNPGDAGLAVKPGPPDAEGNVAVRLDRTPEGGDDEWSLSVSAPRQPELRRSLPRPGRDCAATSQAAAFMISRYLQDIAWREPPPVAVAVAPTAAPEPAIARHWRAAADAVVEGTLGQAGVLPALGLELGVRRDAWELSLGGAVLWPGQQVALSDDTFHDTFQTETVRFELAGGRRLVAIGSSAIWLDVGPGVELNWSTDLDYAPADPGFRPRAIALARARWELPFGDKLAIAVRLEGRLLLGTQPQAPLVNDGDADDPPPIAGDCGLSLAVSYFLF